MSAARSTICGSSSCTTRPAVRERPRAGEVFDAFEINYRYFREVSADAAIEAAGLDRYKYAAYKLSFANNLFVAYATGKLPFDRTSDQIVRVGFSYNLKD